MYLKNQVDTSPAKNVESVDLATQTVISENLLIESNIQFSNKELNLNSYYFDGNRLYISVASEKSKSLNDLNLNSFYINSKSYKKRADIIYNCKELEAIIGEKTNFALVVFNSFKYDKQNKYYVSYNDLNTKEFFIKGNIAKHKNIETANEEMTFNFAEFGTTSTVINCNIDAFIEDSSFKFKTKDNICTAYLIKKSGNNYSFLIPLKLNEASQGYLIANDENGNVKLREVVSFKSNDSKDATTLIIKGYTYGNSEVKKCGFTKIIIQRKKSSESSWSNYKTYNDLFSESNKYKLSKSVAVEKGYQYRAKATHYAKKSLLSTQKIDSTTGSLTF